MVAGRRGNRAGYLVIEDVLTTEVISQINALIDEHAAFKSNGALVNEDSALAGTVRADGRHTMSGMLSWAEPLSAPFRTLLWHPKLVPVLQTVLGDGYRLDNGPLVMTNSPGGGGQRLHGVSRSCVLPLPVLQLNCKCTVAYGAAKRAESTGPRSAIDTMQAVGSNEIWPKAMTTGTVAFTRACVCSRCC